MEALTTVIALGCGIVIGVMLDVLGMHATIAASSKKLKATLADLHKKTRARVEVANERYWAGFSAGVAAYPTLNDASRRDIAEQWRVSEQARRGQSVLQ